MTEPDMIMIDGRAFSWQCLVELRRQQVEAWVSAQARQLVLFELKHDCGPQAERTAADRSQEPSLFAVRFRVTARLRGISWANPTFHPREPIVNPLSQAARSMSTPHCDLR